MTTPSQDITAILTEAERNRRQDRASSVSAGSTSTPMAVGDYTVLVAQAVGGGGNIITLDADGHIPAQYLPPVSGGGGGTGSRAFYDHVQSVPSTTWTIPHQLGGYPAPVIVDDFGVQMHLVDVYYPDANHMICKFGRARSGAAHLTL